jgi:hypothetical protein
MRPIVRNEVRPCTQQGKDHGRFSCALATNDEHALAINHDTSSVQSHAIQATLKEMLPEDARCLAYKAAIARQPDDDVPIARPEVNLLVAIVTEMVQHLEFREQAMAALIRGARTSSRAPVDK